MSYAKQSEILFLWDGENWNPNGDMLNSNAPRYDEISRKALVSDVRIKRTIRDYLESKGFEIFVKETDSPKGGLMDGKGRVTALAGSEKDKVEALKNMCIDVRAFGGVFPVGGETNNLTGSMQFKMSKSLNQTEINYIKGTGAFASSEGKENKTFREEYQLSYALFATYGVVNALNSQNTKLTDADVKTIVDALWFGTKNLISRSKFGQLPRFLLKITYKEAGSYIGGLDNLLVLKTDKPQENEIKSIEDYTIDFSKIKGELEKNSDKIEKIEYVSDGKLNTENLPSGWTKLEYGI
ncbi:type I-B CRISPR-associated protein Cas7/Csh2 [Wolinella succinogenes]|uniref:type I-B CRISPR-associated protein Cas7/Csh2 n=1 Tax=Wolinella succinogenes TaxID=844 RepID=UPI002FCC6541